MATLVVSGRVSEEVKLRADAVIRTSGSSVAKVINDVWQTIAETGQLPASAGDRDERDDQRRAFESFMSWFDELPSQNEAYAHMTDEEILALKVDEHV